MKEDRIEKKIKSLVSRIIEVPEEKVDLNANLYTDLNVDSLIGVEIFTSLDKEYGLDVPEDKLKDINTLNDVVALVKELLSKKEKA
jgi:acyl carrier protein